MDEVKEEDIIDPPIYRYANLHDVTDYPEGFEVVVGPNEGDTYLSWCKITRKSALKKLIPHGMYCYDNRGGCPFHDRITDWPKQNNGWCYYLESGDIVDKCFGLLWDSCKDCSINDNDDDYLQEDTAQNN